MASLTLSALTRRFAGRAAVDDVSLAVADGAFVAILGPSGCGKTTLLRLVAGFERPDAGRIAIDGEVVAGPGRHLPPEARGIGMVFQSYALWPHMSVAGNVGFALRMRGMGRGAIAARVEAVLAMVGLAGFGPRRPAELSGGQRQRVALARCLAMEPRLILMDEPLSNLDAPLREAMHVELRRLHRESGRTVLYVTHDQDEAMALADRIVVLHEGQLQQEGPPQTLYDRPANRLVAEFFGRGTVLPIEPLGPDGNGRLAARLFGAPVRLRWQGSLGHPPAAAVKAEHLALQPPEAPGAGFAARVESCAFAGRGYRLRLRPLAAPDTVLTLDSIRPFEAADAVAVAVTDGFALPGGAAPAAG